MKEEIASLLLELELLGKDISEVKLWRELLEAMNEKDQEVLLEALRKEKEFITKTV
jgi:hypothetical protein